MKKNYAVVFDMDGVIVHTNPHHIIAFRAFFDKHNVQYNEADFDNHLYGKHNDYIMRYFFGQNISQEKVDELAQEKEAMFREIYKTHAQPISGWMDFLNDLKLNHFKTGVATSAPRANLEFVMDILQFGNKMESHLSGDDVTHHKPHPEEYLKSMDNLGVQPNDTVIFEDSHSGVSAAIASGAKVVGVLSTHSKDELPPCDYYIKDYTHLSVNLIKSLIDNKS